MQFYRDPLVVWLLPLSYAFHILEEWFGAFIVINAVALLLMFAATHATTKREANGWMGVAIATILLVNGFAHILGTLLTRAYSPGLFTSVVLYLPIAQLVLFRAWTQAEGAAFGRGVAAGLALHAAVIVVAYSASL